MEGKISGALSEMNKTERLLSELTAEISKNLQQGRYRFPTERELTLRYRCSRRTVRAALQALSEKGYLRRIQGSGCFLSGLSPTERENRIALLLEQPDDYTHPALVHALRDNLRQRGFRLEVFDTRADFFEERRILSTHCLGGGFRGIFSHAFRLLENPNLDLYERLSHAGTPILFLHRGYENFPFPSLSPDEYGGVRQAVQLLRRSHPKRLIGIFHTDIPEEALRLSAFLRVLREEGLPFSGYFLLLLSADLPSEEMRRQIRHFLQTPPANSALLCGSDRIAQQVMELCAALRIAVPAELSLLSFDESYLSMLGEFRFSSYGLHSPGLGEAAADWMLQKAGGQTPPPALLHWELSHYDTVLLR